MEKNSIIGVLCPKCGGDVIKRQSKRKRIFYGCNNYPNCDFISWDEPTNEKCEHCGKPLFKKAIKNSKPFCSNKECVNSAGSKKGSKSSK